MTDIVSITDTAVMTELCDIISPALIYSYNFNFLYCGNPVYKQGNKKSKKL